MIEVLTAIAIIVVLVSIVFAGFRAVLASAKSASCASRLKQIGLGLTLYSHDYDEVYPPYTFEGIGKLPAYPKQFKLSLATYRVSDDQFYCPLDPHARTVYQGEHGTHFDASYEMSIDYYNHGKVVGGIFRFTPSAVADLTQVNVFEDASDLISDEEGTISRSGAHGKRYNVLRADGSVANLPIVQPKG